MYLIIYFVTWFFRRVLSFEINNITISDFFLKMYLTWTCTVWNVLFKELFTLYWKALCKESEMMLDIKKLIVLFCHTLRVSGTLFEGRGVFYLLRFIPLKTKNIFSFTLYHFYWQGYGFSVGHLLELLLEMR